MIDLLKNATLTEILVVLVNVLVVGYLLFKMVRRGGVKNSLFDARIETTVGEAEGAYGGMGKVRLKVHTMDRDGEAMVGIECVSRQFGEMALLTVRLTPAQTRTLGALLLRAAG
jgi:hypothetical protein